LPHGKTVYSYHSTIQQDLYSKNFLDLSFLIITNSIKSRYYNAIPKNMGHPLTELLQNFHEKIQSLEAQLHDLECKHEVSQLHKEFIKMHATPLNTSPSLETGCVPAKACTTRCIPAKACTTKCIPAKTDIAINYKTSLFDWLKTLRPATYNDISTNKQKNRDAIHNLLLPFIRKYPAANLDALIGYTRIWLDKNRTTTNK